MHSSRFAILLAAALALAACQKAEEKKSSGPPATLITVTQARAGAMEITEETFGSLEAVIDPKLGAEVPGKVVQVLAGAGKAVRKGELLAVIDDADFALQHRADEAERRRTEALLAQQERVVERQHQLMQKGFHFAECRGRCPRPKVHFQAPDFDRLEAEMKRFCDWFNKNNDTDAVLKAAIAHLWFVTIHPFDDGNGRIARAITDLQLARADNSHQRFYSMSAQIRKERATYYSILERTQQNTLDITHWLEWFLQCLQRALVASSETLETVLFKAAFWEKHKETIFNNRQLTMLNKLLDGIDGKLSSSKWAKMAKCSSATAIGDINDLLEKEVLVKDGAGGRSTGI